MFDELMRVLSGEQLIIQAIEFGAQTMTIYYQEQREVANTAIVSRVMEILVDDASLPEQQREVRMQRYLNLQEILRDIIDDTYVDIRNEAS